MKTAALLILMLTLFGCMAEDRPRATCLRNHVEPTLVPIIGPGGDMTLMMLPSLVCDEWSKPLPILPRRPRPQPEERTP